MTDQVVAVVFDIGETLVDETRHWSALAHFAGLSDLTVMGVLGGLIERREHHRSLFGYLQIESVDPTIFGYEIEERDLYPDAVPVIRQLKTAGYLIGVTGNQPRGAVHQFQALGLPVDFVGSSAEWNVAKPDPAFFRRIATELDLNYQQILYVGDRLDNDVLPAQQLGMHAAFLRRGPWGYLQATWPGAADVTHRIDSLNGIFRVLERINAQAAAVPPAQSQGKSG